jgi:hypothetical protein
MELLTMKRHNPAQAVLVNALAAIAAIVVFFMVLHIADQGAQAAHELHQLDKQAQAATQRMHRAAATLCQAEAGPGAQAAWLDDGSLICRPAVITATKGE